MKRLLGVFLICLTALPAFCQSISGWKVATITEVRIHESGEKVGASDAVSYYVSVKVGCLRPTPRGDCESMLLDVVGWFW